MYVIKIKYVLSTITHFRVLNKTNMYSINSIIATLLTIQYIIEYNLEKNSDIILLHIICIARRKKRSIDVRKLAYECSIGANNS